MRTEEQIVTEKLAAINEYRDAVDTKTRGDIELAKGRIRELSDELDAVISKNSNPCPNCGNHPMGMIKTPAHSKDGVDYPQVYEVGCIHCDPFLVDREDGAAVEVGGKRSVSKRASYSARAFSAKDAVKKWNDGGYVEDFYFDRTPGLGVTRIEN